MANLTDQISKAEEIEQEKIEMIKKFEIREIKGTKHSTEYPAVAKSNASRPT